MLTLEFAGSHIGLLEKGANPAMNKKKRLLRAGLVCAMALAAVIAVIAAGAVSAARAQGNAEEEIGRLAELMGWKAGTVAADIGAGDGAYTFAAVERVGAAGKVYATEIDAKKIEAV